MSAFGMMVTQAGCFDREACYEGRNQGNVRLKISLQKCAH